MQVDLTRDELLILCKHAVSNSKPDSVSTEYGLAYERRDFINGFHYRLSDKWAIKQSDEELYQFYLKYRENKTPTLPSGNDQGELF